jgi:anti-anti-sigma factor
MHDTGYIALYAPATSGYAGSGQAADAPAAYLGRLRELLWLLGHVQTLWVPLLRTVKAVAEGVYPIRWTGEQAVMTFPEQVDVSNAGQIREQLLSVINRGAAVVIADMTDTVSCDHAGVDAIGRAYQRALVSGTELRLVVGSEIVRRVLTMSGVDRAVSIYPFVAACLAAKKTDAGTLLTLGERSGGRFRSDTDVGVEVAMLDRDGVIVWVNEAWQLFAVANGGDLSRAGTGVSYLDICDAAGDDPTTKEVAAAIRGALEEDLPDPIALEVPCHSPQMARWFDMLISTRNGDNGRPLGATVTLSLARSEDWAMSAEAELGEPELGGRARMARMGTNGHTVPGQAAPAPAHLAGFARAAAQQARHRQVLLDRITTSLYGVGLTLQDATDQPPDAVRQAITDALEGLDTTIREIRDVAFTDSINSFPPPQDEN